MLTGMRQRTRGEGLRLFQAAGQYLCLPQGQTAERLKAYHFCCYSLFQCLREQRHGVSHTPAQRVRCAQGCSYPEEIVCVVRLLTDAYGLLKPGQCPGQVTLAEGQQTNSIRS